MKRLAFFAMLGLILICYGCAGLPRPAGRTTAVTRIGTANLIEDTVWEGVVEISGVVTIPSGVTLTIKPATRVRFEPTQERLYGSGNGLVIQGTLRAIGSETEKIIFTSASEQPRKGDWNDIFFLVSEDQDNILDHCVIEYANIGVHGHFTKVTIKNCQLTNNWRAFQIKETVALITDNLIRDNQYGIRFRDSEIELRGNELLNMYSGIETFRSKVKIFNNTVRNCYITSVKCRETETEFSANVIENCRQGLQVTDSKEVKIISNRFIANFEHGVALKNSRVVFRKNEVLANGGDGISVNSTFLQAGYNNITGNGKYAIDNKSELGIDARNNWWGGSNLARIRASFYDYAVEESLGRVDYRPILNKPVEIDDTIPQEVLLK